MTPYTLTLAEARNRLDDMIGETRQAHREVVITDEEAEPLAILVEAGRYEALISGDSRSLIQGRLSKLETLLQTLRAHWDAEAVRRAFPRAFWWHLEGLWEVGQHRERAFRQLVVLLQIATDGLDRLKFSREQLSALESCIDTLRKEPVSRHDLERCDELLMRRGFEVMIPLDDETFQQYVNES